jgi:large subunit ribosomal protein L23
METSEIIKYPISSEKSIRLMESENKLMFVVDRRAKKPQIKQTIQDTFKVKIVQLNTYIGTDGKKRAYVKLSKATPAIDVATKLGLM